MHILIEVPFDNSDEFESYLKEEIKNNKINDKIKIEKQTLEGFDINVAIGEINIENISLLINVVGVTSGAYIFGKILDIVETYIKSNKRMTIEVKKIEDGNVNKVVIKGDYSNED
jgi:hypothetical protein